MPITNEKNITAVMQHNRFPIPAQNVHLYRMLSCPKLKIFKIQTPARVVTVSMFFIDYIDFQERFVPPFTEFISFELLFISHSNESLAP